MSLTVSPPSAGWTADPGPLRCRACGGPLAPGEEGLDCPGCGARYPIRDGVLVVQDEPASDNRIARDFYDGPLWPRFRFWERLFYLANGGERQARCTILKHLPSWKGLRLLDVAVGDGVYLDWLPDDWNLVGIDVSRAQLDACRARNARRAPRLVLGEAEQLPFREGAFDAVLCLGGFNLFHDPEAALREMVRVVRPGATIVISDEMPNLVDRLPGRRLGRPKLDRWIASRLLHLGDAFTDLIGRRRALDVPALGRRVLEYCQFEVICRGGAYLMVGQAPTDGRALAPPAPR